MKLTVVLGISSNEMFEESFDIELFQTPFVTKWFEEFKWCLNNCDFNQEEIFADFQPLQNCAVKLENACVTINKYLNNFIDIQPDLVNQSQDYFNYLHKKFEHLSGEFGKPTKLFSIANDELKSAIRRLNFYIHKIEKRETVSKFYFSFNKDQYRRFKFADEDYENFQFKVDPGTLVLHYVELGKNFYDLYKDGLPIDYVGLKNLHYYSGEASILFNGYNQPDAHDYIKWLKNNQLDPTGKKLGHGKICLGKVSDINNVHNKICQSDYIKKIIIGE